MFCVFKISSKLLNISQYSTYFGLLFHVDDFEGLVNRVLASVGLKQAIACPMSHRFPLSFSLFFFPYCKLAMQIFFESRSRSTDGSKQIDGSQSGAHHFPTRFPHLGTLLPLRIDYLEKVGLQ